MERTIHFDRLFPNSPETVWRCLTEPTLLGKWFMPNDISPVIGAEFTFRMKPQKGWNGNTYCSVTEVEPISMIAYTYGGEATGEKPLRACAKISRTY